MREWVKDALRSGVVVIGAVAFGHLTLKLAFKPYLEAQQQQQQQHLQSVQQEKGSSSLSSDSRELFDDSNILISDEGYSKSGDS